jgi:hypothetical protein
MVLISELIFKYYYTAMLVRILVITFTVLEYVNVFKQAALCRFYGKL